MCQVCPQLEITFVCTLQDYMLNLIRKYCYTMKIDINKN